MKNHRVLYSFLLLALFTTLTRADINVVTENFPPYNYEEGGQILGLSTDIVNKVLARTGKAYNINIYPWARAYAMATHADNRNTFIYTIVRTPEREETFDWLLKLASADPYLVGMAGLTSITPESVRNSTYRATCVHEDAACEWLRSLGFTGNRLIEVGDIDGSSEIRMVAAGRAEFFIADKVYLPFRMRQLKLTSTPFIEYFRVKEGQGYYLAAAKTVDPALRQLVRDAAKALVAEGHSIEILAPAK